MDLTNELEPNTNPDNADRRHIQHVLDTHEAGRLVEVLACEEAIDGAWWTCLVRDINGNLRATEVSSEPGYNNVEHFGNYTI
jgi:hypothetical protein